MAKGDFENDEGLDSDIDCYGEDFFSNPENKELFEKYTSTLRRAAKSDRIDIVEKEYDTLQNDSDLPEDPDLKYVYNILMAVFNELLSPDYKPEPKDDDKPDPQMGLF